MCVCSLYGALGVYKPVYISIETFYIDLLTILCFKQSFKKYFRIDISIIQFHPDKTKNSVLSGRMKHGYNMVTSDGCNQPVLSCEPCCGYLRSRNG